MGNVSHGLPIIPIEAGTARLHLPYDVHSAEVNQVLPHPPERVWVGVETLPTVTYHRGGPRGTADRPLAVGDEVVLAEVCERHPFDQRFDGCVCDPVSGRVPMVSARVERIEWVAQTFDAPHAWRVYLTDPKEQP